VALFSPSVLLTFTYFIHVRVLALNYGWIWLYCEDQILELYLSCRLLHGFFL
jgi:hypothetical protein